MKIIDITKKEKKEFNRVVTHPLQSFEWGEFRQKLGTTVIRKGFGIDGAISNAIQVTVHPIPYTFYSIGYCGKSILPTDEMSSVLFAIGRTNRNIFIQLEPNVIKNSASQVRVAKLLPAVHPLFTKYTFLLDLTPIEGALLKNMHPKTRYNIKIAQKHQVEVREDNSEEAFEDYLRLTDETTKRQGFYAHTPQYHRVMWETLQPKKETQNAKHDHDELRAHLFLAKYKGETLAAWIVFVFHDTLYYPYGSSSNLHREVMASNLLMWEIIKWGKQQGLNKFDMWGALGPNPNPNDPWFGFHRFKQGYGAALTEFVGSFDLVITPFLYQGFKIADKLRWSFLSLKKRM